MDIRQKSRAGRSLIPILFFVLICLTVFWPYVFRNKILFPSNLLVSFYTPFNTMKFDGWEQGIPFKGLGYDALLYFHPSRVLLNRALSQHTFPLWNPYNFSGSPYFGDGQSAVFYPLTWLSLLIPLPDAFSMGVISVAFLSLTFTYLLLTHLGLSRSASVFGAVAFAFSGYMSVWMEENPAVAHSALWLPMLLFAADILLTKGGKFRFVLLSLLTFIVAGSGFLQIVIYEFLFLATFVLFRLRGSTIPSRRALLVAGSVCFGLLLAAPYLFTTWEAYRLSPRELSRIPEIRSIYLVHWSHLISFFSPDWLGNPGSYNYHGMGTYYDKALFIGFIPLIFFLLSTFAKKTPTERFFLVGGAVTLFLGISSPFTRWLFGLPIPILSSMLPSRIFYLTTFSFSVLAAFGFDRLVRTDNPRLLGPLLGRVGSGILVCAILVELFILSFMAEQHGSGMWIGSIGHTIRTAIEPTVRTTTQLPMITLRNSVFSAAVISLAFVAIYALIRVRRIRRAVPILLILLTLVSSWYMTRKSLYFGERQFFFPDHPLLTELSQRAGIGRVAFADDASRIKSALNVNYDIFSPEGMNPVFSYRYGQLVKAAENGGSPIKSIPRISVEIPLNPTSTAAAFTTRRLLSLLNITHIVQRIPKDNDWYQAAYPSHRIVWEDGTYRIWENPDAYPRAFMTHTVLAASDDKHWLELLFDERTDLRNQAILDQPVFPEPPGVKVATESVRMRSYRMNDMVLEVSTSRSGMLVVSDTWAPGWKATVDDVPAKVYRADFALRSIPVPAGIHIVKLVYWPDSFLFGLLAMAGSGAVLIFIGVWGIAEWIVKR